MQIITPLLKRGFAGRRVSPAPKKAYIATAQALDDEMKERIEKHKKERLSDWITFEEPVNIAALIKDIQDKYDIILFDCLTLWLSNLILNNFDTKKEIESLIIAVHA